MVQLSLQKALPKGRLPDLGRSTVAARFDQERAAVKLWLKDVAPSTAAQVVRSRPGQTGNSFRSVTGKNWARRRLPSIY